MKYEFKIPTRRGYILVVLNDFLGMSLDFFASTDHGLFYNHLNHREVSKSVWNRARCFLSDPKRYGVRKRSF